jgi:cyclohexyl-isocyanide hydratase
MTTRRELLQMLTIAAAAAPFAASAAKASIPTQAENDAMQAAMKKSADAHVKLMEVPGLNMHGSEQIAMLMYPGFTALDLIGPHYFFASLLGATVHLVTTQADLTPVKSDLGLSITPTITMANTPKRLGR